MPKEIAGKLFEKEVIKNEDLEKMQETKSRSEKTEVMLKAVAKSNKVMDVNTMIYFQSVLRECGYAHLLKNFNTRKSMFIHI